MPEITVIGAGLAGAEAAWQAAERGCAVRLYEMRPGKMTPAHHTGECAELVCSNSLRAAALENAVGLLKEEMRRAGSLIMRCADEFWVPAGGALAVDREKFSRAVTEHLLRHPRILLTREEVREIPSGTVVIASGPLTSGALAEAVAELLGTGYLYFYDAVAPIVDARSIDLKIAFRASRYGKGEDDYLNCPMTEEEYDRFYQALAEAEVHARQEFEAEVFFEGCMPVEALARRGRRTLAFGPMKPVGLVDPRTGRQPYAVVQLRQDNAAATMYNMVGFQTHLTWPEQRRVFRMIPGLEGAEFPRFGVMHRNTFINSPAVLAPTLQLKKQERIFFAGQITGVEGYVESAAGGLVAGINAALFASGGEPAVFPPETALGSLCHYITGADPKHFQPMNVTFGLMPPLERRIRNRKERNRLLARRALDSLDPVLARVPAGRKDRNSTGEEGR